MVEIDKDKKSNTYIITKTDSEGFHHQLNVTEEELIKLANSIFTIYHLESTNQQ